jgi:hypothetical protein
VEEWQRENGDAIIIPCDSGWVDASQRLCIDDIDGDAEGGPTLREELARVAGVAFVFLPGGFGRNKEVGFRPPPPPPRKKKNIAITTIIAAIISFFFFFSIAQRLMGGGGCPQILPFFTRVCNAGLLSRCLRAEVITTDSHYSSELSEALARTVPHLQRMLRRVLGEEGYAKSNDAHREALAGFRCVVAGDLHASYRLQGTPPSTSMPEASTAPLRRACILHDEGEAGWRLYVWLPMVTEHARICAEFSRLFFCGRADKSVADFVHRLALMHMAGMDPERIERHVVGDCGLPPLPEGEAVWRIAAGVASPDAAAAAFIDSAAQGRAVSASDMCAISEAELRDQRDREEACEARRAEILARVARRAAEEAEKRPATDYAGDGGRRGGGQHAAADGGAAGFSHPTAPPVGSGAPHPSGDNGGSFRMASRQVMEEIAVIGSHPIPSSVLDTISASPSSSIASDAVGRWGEEAVCRHLSTTTDGGRHTVEWVNGEVERGLPYDVVVSPRAERGGGEEDTLYVEVKTTTRDAAAPFELSYSQLEFAQRHRGMFHIYRVVICGRGGGGVRFYRIVDPVEQFRHGLLVLYALPSNLDGREAC